MRVQRKIKKREREGERGYRERVREDTERGRERE